jgi:hypothetical protein
LQGKLRRRLIVAVISLSFVASAHAATSADRHNVLFDQVATQVAGHPVTVFCEDDWADWLVTNEGVANNGFTNVAVPEVFISPRQCETLQALADHEDVGTYFAASALLTLVHEAIHQRGILDEGVTDCTAIPLVAGVATQFFGIPATVDEISTVSRRVTSSKRVKVSRRIKVKGRYVTAAGYTTITRSVPVVTSVTTAVPNPWLDRLAIDLEVWHRSKPVAYQGTC